MDITLVIMAAGIGSRYGGVKQLDGIGPNGETIMDYSIYDAIEAGFTKVVFIIRKELQEAFNNHYMERFSGRIAIEYVYQDQFKKYEDQYAIDRSKPWGTGHAMLSTRDKVHTPFAILNADDFYGKDAFRIMATTLKENRSDDTVFLLGYKMINTLSDHGTVSRALCNVDKESYLTSIRELTKIGKKEGEIVYEEHGKYNLLQPNDLVSMNFWGFVPSVFEDLDREFKTFIDEHHQEPGAEFYIPTFVDIMLRKGKIDVKVITTDETWLGVTYREDKPVVMEGIREYINRGLYPEEIR